MQGKFHNQQLLALLKKLESVAFSGTVNLDLEIKDQNLSKCILAWRNGSLMYAVPCLPDIHAIIDFLEHKLHRQWIAPAVVFASRQLKDEHSTQELIERLIAMELFTWGEIEAVFYAQTIVRLEQIWECGGSFQIEKNVNLELRSAWKVGDLLLELAHRKDRWAAIKPVIPSLKLIPMIATATESSPMPHSVKKHLVEWVDGKRSLCDISQGLDKDPLQIAQFYAKWSKEKWVNFISEETNAMPLILAIDDSAVVQQMIQRTLSSFCRVAVASNAVDGLSVMYHQPVKLLLLDVMMPEIDGLEVCRTIRRMPQFSNLPIIMLTGKDGFFDKMKGKMAGSNEYITKPFEASSLKQLVRQYLNLPMPMTDSNAEAISETKTQARSPARSAGQTVDQLLGNRATACKPKDTSDDQMATSIQYQCS
ncbi:response regulator [Pseudanabaena sp. FACHB-1277]|uniref:Response regulator n=1 Tax=Pseudanabaena cinerea FACHB-1277 TaxID=2949581 RepID=A0A926UU99_9CYAN|nr:response regulator [Pseudanabaena cinerea]MBD2151359.1 response regulator [Pseudanabaena cinerea FACHB-1277]